MKHSPELLSKVYASFCIYLKLKDYKTGNGTMYPQGVRDFLIFSKSQDVIYAHQIDKTLLQEYAIFLGNRPNKRRSGLLSGITINHYLYGIKLFLTYLLDCGYLSSIPLYPSMMIHQKKERPVLTIDDIHILFNQCRSYRDKALLALAYGCGMRRQEISDLNLQEVLTKEGYLIVRYGKNAKRREIPLSSAVIDHLNDYIINERTQYNEPSSAFLLSDSGRRMTGGSIYSYYKLIVNRSCSCLSFSSPTLHDLRHAIATHMMGNGAGIEFIKDFLGHALIDTAQLYSIKQKQKT